MPDFGFAWRGDRARRWHRSRLTRGISFRTEALFDDLDCGAERQTMCLKQRGGTAVAIADDGSKHDAAVDIIATTACCCCCGIQNAPKFI